MKKYLKETAKYMLRSYPLVRRYVREIDRMYAMTAEELRERNEKKFIELFRLAYEKSPFYHRLYSDAGVGINDVKTLGDITKLPVVTKDMVKRHGKELLTRSPKGLLTNHTSGTTGTPLTVYENWESLWREQAYFICYRKRCGFDYGNPLISLRGTLGHNDTSMKVHVSNTLYLSSYNINERTAELYHRAIASHISTPLCSSAIEGYPSSLYNLALVFRDKGLTCNIPLAFTSSETLYEHQRAMIEKVFNCQIYDHYGTTERTIRLEEDFNHDGYFEDPGYGIVEYYDDYTLSTSLINTAFPLIRYRTDDRIIMKEGTTKTKENLIEGIEGRSEDFIVCKDGTKLMSLGFVVKDVEGVDKSQMVQTKEGEVEVRVVPSKDGLASDAFDTIRHRMEERCGKDNMKVSVRQVTDGELIYSDKRKFKYIHSEIHRGGVNSVLSEIACIEGRAMANIEGKDGTQYSDVGLTFIFKDVGNVRKAQFVQREKGKVNLNIVAEQQYSEIDEKQILKMFEIKVGHENMDIEIRLIDESELLYGKNNKLALVVRKEVNTGL